MPAYPLMDPKVDFAFKQIFAGPSSDSLVVLTHLLNAILGRYGHPIISEILYLNPHNEKEYKDDKQSALDIKVKTGTGEIIDIEMQILNADDYRKRSLYYWALIYGGQLTQGKGYYNLKKCIVISILNFNLIRETGKYQSRFKIFEPEQGFMLLDDLEIHYLELPKFCEHKNINDLTTLEEWLLFIKDAAEKDKVELITALRQKNEVIEMAGKILERISQDEKARIAYEQRQKWLRDQASSQQFLLHKGREEGRIEGRIEGKIEGKVEEQLAIAGKLLQMGLSPEKVAEATGLTMEQVERLNS